MFGTGTQTTHTTHTPYFIGDVVTRWLMHHGRDRLMAVERDFGYVDRYGELWLVPGGTVINGSNVPMILWPVLGSPYISDMRRASVLHDYYCMTRSRPARRTHRMFYEAGLTDGCRPFTARAYYTGVFELLFELSTRDDLVVRGVDPRLAIFTTALTPRLAIW